MKVSSVGHCKKGEGKEVVVNTFIDIESGEWWGLSSGP